MHLRNAVTCTALIMMLFVSSSANSVELTPGMMLSNSCAGCHGTDGKSPGEIPSLQGKSEDFIKRALTDFSDGTRLSTVMGRHAKGYSDAEIMHIAKHFAKFQ